LSWITGNFLLLTRYSCITDNSVMIDGNGHTDKINIFRLL
jgi:hypothetical protein